MAVNGSRDLRIVLSPAGENSCCSRSGGADPLKLERQRLGRKDEPSLRQSRRQRNHQAGASDRQNPAQRLDAGPEKKRTAGLIESLDARSSVVRK